MTTPMYDAKALVERAGQIGFKPMIQEIETAVISEALQSCNNVCNQAAKALKLHKVTLLQKRHRFGFPVAAPAARGPQRGPQRGPHEN